ncbi:MAG: 1-deoxy-D-xylulose-5-phosphate reductoisomerase [bacterium]|nr:1-deoxy-D-xylulose-5-phosphate reductoisomerase [bacterium]
MKRVTVLGATGSVGRNTLDVVENHRDRFEVVGLSAGRNVDLLQAQSERHPGAMIAVQDEEAHEALVKAAPEMNSRSIGSGDEALITLVDKTRPDLVVNCLVGFAGLRPTLHALSLGIGVAIANKESIVAGGELLMRTAKESGAPIIPIDSEHVAVDQCLRGCRREDIKMVYITASGGSLRDTPIEDLETVTREEVLAHPTWNMGDKITVDSATLLNKGLEVIEAHWLFDLPLDRIRVVIHPQSIIHSMVELQDNSILAQMGLPDMRLPILYALSRPDRIPTDLARSRISDFPDLSFREVDEARYPCLGLALRAAREGANRPTVLNSANEMAVGAYLAGRVSFVDIHRIIENSLDNVPSREIETFEDIVETDATTRAYTRKRFQI